MSNESVVNVSVPAELQKISQVVIDGIKSYKGGKSWQEIGVAALPAVLAEFGSFDEIKEELSSDKLVPFIGLVLGSVAGVFLAKGAQAMLAKRKAKLQAAHPVHAVDGALPSAHEATVHA